MIDFIVRCIIAVLAYILFVGWLYKKGEILDD